MSTVTPDRLDLTTTEFRNAVASGLNFARRINTSPALLDPGLADRIYHEGMAAHFVGHNFIFDPLPKTATLAMWIVERINKEIVGPPIDDIEFMV